MIYILKLARRERTKHSGISYFHTRLIFVLKESVGNTERNIAVTT